MLPFDTFSQALPYDRFLAEYGSPGDRAKWDATRSAVALTDDQVATLKSFKRQTHVLVLAGAWCGDCVSQCPIFERFAEVAPVLAVRYLDSRTHADAQAELKVNGGDRVPVAVFFSEDGHEVGRYGDRTLAEYRRMAAHLAGEACATGIVTNAGHLAAVAADWLREFERVQYILRLSPRLRKRHND